MQFRLHATKFRMLKTMLARRTRNSVIPDSMI